MANSGNQGGSAGLPIVASGVWKVFGKRVGDAMEMARGKVDQAEILAKSGCVVAVQDATFEVNWGEVFVVMGTVGQWKVHPHPVPLAID